MTGFISDAQRQAINQSLAAWRQGDVSFDAGIESLHFADISIPHSPWSIREFQRLSSSNMPVPGGITPICHRVEGLVVLSQTCDVIRDCVDRPFVEIAPLVQLDARIVEETRLLRRPSFGFVPATENRCLVADLDRPLTIEKSIVARWNRVAGWNTLTKRFVIFRWRLAENARDLLFRMTSSWRLGTCNGVSLAPSSRA